VVQGTTAIITDERSAVHWIGLLNAGNSRFLYGELSARTWLRPTRRRFSYLRSTRP